jgi:preprotein translocase subunit SecE
MGAKKVKKSSDVANNMMVESKIRRPLFVVSMAVIFIALAVLLGVRGHQGKVLGIGRPLFFGVATVLSCLLTLAFSASGIMGRFLKALFIVLMSLSVVGLTLINPANVMHGMVLGGVWNVSLLAIFSIGLSARGAFGDWLKWSWLVGILASMVYWAQVYSSHSQGLSLMGTAQFLHDLVLVCGWLVTVGLCLIAASLTSAGSKGWTFLKSSRDELYKVIWPTKPQVMTTALMVAVVVIFMSILLFGVDTAFQSLIKWLVGF